MGKFLYKSINKLPSGKIFIRYATNPMDAQKLGGVLTCRLVQNCNPTKNMVLKGRVCSNIPPPIR